MTAAARTHRPLRYAAALAAALALAGCTGRDPGPAVTTPPITSGTASTTTTTPPAPTSTTATPVDPVLAKIPAAARANTEGGAKAFARFFFDSLNRSAIAADPTILDGLFAKNCKTCVAMHSSVADLRTQGRHHSGPTIKTEGISTSSFVAERRVILVRVTQRAVDVLDGSGRKVDRTLADTGTFAVSLDFVAEHWVVSRLQTVAS